MNVLDLVVCFTNVSDLPCSFCLSWYQIASLFFCNACGGLGRGDLPVCHVLISSSSFFFFFFLFFSASRDLSEPNRSMAILLVPHLPAVLCAFAFAACVGGLAVFCSRSIIVLSAGRRQCEGSTRGLPPTWFMSRPTSAWCSCCTNWWPTPAKNRPSPSRQKWPKSPTLYEFSFVLDLWILCGILHCVFWAMYELSSLFVCDVNSVFSVNYNHTLWRFFFTCVTKYHTSLCSDEFVTGWLLIWSVRNKNSLILSLKPSTFMPVLVTVTHGEGRSE